MEYDESNNGSIPLLLIHGFLLDRTSWTAQLRGIKARTIAPDLCGFGKSPMLSPAVTIDTYAEDMRVVLDELNIKNAVIAGLSMGGYITLAFYRKYPQYVRALILANTRAGPDSAEGKKGRDENVALVKAKGVPALAEKLMPKMLTPKTTRERPEIAKSVGSMLSRQPVVGTIPALLAMRDRPDAMPALAQISVPTLIITGSEDILLPPQEAELMRDGLRGAKLVVIPGAAHLSNIDQPDAFNQAVNDFLKTIS